MNECLYTYPRDREISSSWVLCSGCPFSVGFILYCGTSWDTWLSWFENGQWEVGCKKISTDMNATVPHCCWRATLTIAISLVLLPISLSTWWSSRLSCSLETAVALAPPVGHLDCCCCWDAAPWPWLGCTGWPAIAPLSLCNSKKLLAA